MAQPRQCQRAEDQARDGDRRHLVDPSAAHLHQCRFARPAGCALYRGGRDVADDYPRAVHPVGDRYRLCRTPEPVGLRQVDGQALGQLLRIVAGILVVIALLMPAQSFAADAAFEQWLQSVWPQAEALGVSRTTFDAAIRGLESDYSLPDLAIPGRPEKPPPGQPEFVQTPSQYLREATFDRLATRGRQLAAQYRDTLSRIEREIGVPGNVALAIWARETDYGGYSLPHDAIRVLATQAYAGKRKDFFRNEFLHVLKMLQDGVPRAD